MFPRWQNRNHPREIAIRWAPVNDMDEQYPWLILGSEGPQRLDHDAVQGCEALQSTAVAACQAADID